MGNYYRYLILVNQTSSRDPEMDLFVKVYVLLSQMWHIYNQSWEEYIFAVDSWVDNMICFACKECINSYVPLHCINSYMPLHCICLPSFIAYSCSGFSSKNWFLVSKQLAIYMTCVAIQV